MTSFAYADEDEVKAALADVKSDAKPDNWLVLTYDPKERLPNTITLKAKGDGDTEDMKAVMDDERAIYYAYLRVYDQIDESVTTKFVVLIVMPESIKGIKKGRVTTHSGDIRDLLSPSTTQEHYSKVSDIHHDDIMEKVTLISGSGSRVRSGDVMLGYKGQSRDFKAEKGTKVKQFAIEDEDSISAAVKDVRNDTTDTTWCALTLDSDYSTVKLLGKGTEPVEELLDNFAVDKCCWMILRVEEQVDDSLTTKFAFVDWVGDGILPTYKTMINTYRMEILRLVEPYHVDFHPTSTNEISTEIIKDRVAAASQQKSNVVNNAASSPAGYRRKALFADVRDNQGGGGSVLAVEVEDESGIREAIANVRNDTMGHNWIAVGYVDINAPKSLCMVGTGSGGLDELVANFDADSVLYCLYRTESVVDLSTTVKFVFLDWQGNSIKGTSKAKIATHKGFVHELFAPYHCDIVASQMREVTEVAIREVLDNLKK